MATFNLSQQFAEDLCKGVHNFTNATTGTVTVLLSNTAGDADVTKAQKSEITAVSTSNLDTVLVLGIGCEQTSGTVHLTATDLTMTASGAVGPFQYIWLYNEDSTDDKLIGYYDYGSAVTMQASDQLVINFNTDILTLA